MKKLIMTDRIIALKEKMQQEPRYASIEQARIITRAYQQHEGRPRILQRALALKAALEEIEIRIDAGELIVGNRTAGCRAGVVFPESGSTWVDREFESLPERPQDRFQVHAADIREFREEIYPYWQGKSLEDVLRQRYGSEIDAISPVVKINQKDHAQGHICPDCRRWLEAGPRQLQELALRQQGQTAGEKRDFYEAAALTLEGAQTFMQRYAELAESMAEKAGTAAESGELLLVARNCRALSRRPAQSFSEALQSLWFLFVILQLESNASSFSPGRIDEILWPYYERDRRENGLSEQQALEYIECLWLKFNQIVYMRNQSSAKFFAGFPIGFNVAIGGQDSEGRDFVNELSYLFLQAQKQLGLPQPNLSVRLHEHTSEALLREAVRVVAKGSGMPQFFNDKAVIPGLEGLGIDTADARDYAVVGCVELTPQGNNLGWSDAAMFNLNKVLELTLNGGRCLLSGRRLAPNVGDLTKYETFAALQAAFQQEIQYFIAKMVKACEQVEKAHMDLLPTPFLSAVIADCLQQGRDVTRGGAKYNLSGIQMIQIANLADSLAALKSLVYEQQLVSRGELLTALRDNFAGHELLRARILNKVPKYGNDVDWVDELGAECARYFRRELGRYRNYRGGAYHTGMYTVSAHVPMGEKVGASPDGRLAGQPLADGGMSPVYGRDVSGPTAVLKSAAKLDKELTTNGGLLNMKFLPDFFQSETGVEKFAMFLRAFVDLEIPHIQFNVVRPEDLLAAKAHPEQYRGLTVRVAGYTAYFTELAGDLQDEIIARTSYGAV